MSTNWIAQRRLQKEMERAREKADDARAIAVAFILKDRIPVFLDHLKKEIKIQVDALSDLDISGSASFSGNVESEEQCRIDIARTDTLEPCSTFTTLFYANGDRIIRQSPKDNRKPELQFFVVDQDVKLSADNGVTTMDAEYAAEHIVRSMADKLGA